MFIEDIKTLKDVYRVGFWQKRHVLIFLFGAFLSAISEMVFLALLYTIFSSGKKNVILNWVRSVPRLSSEQISYVDKNLTYLLITFAITVLLFRLFCAITGRFALAKAQVKTSVTLSDKTISCFINAHPTAWTPWKKEKIVHIITYESGVSGEAVYTAINMLMSLMVLAALVTGAFIISAKLTIFSVLVGIAVVAINYTNYAKAKRIGVIKNKAKAQLLGNAYDVVSGHKILKLEGGEEFAKTRSYKVITDSFSWVLEKARNINMVMSFSELFIYFFFFGLVIMANIFKIADQAVLLTLLVISIRLQGAVRELQNQWITYQELIPNFLDVQKMLSYADGYLMKSREVSPKEITQEGAAIRLENIEFFYEPNGPPIIRGLGMVFPGGKRFLIKGGSGSGKSTLINMLCGILQPARGAIYLDGEKLTRENFYQIRRFISYSSPDAYIFRESIRNNIALGMDSTDSDVLEAIRAAGLEDFVRKLEGGIHSVVADNASNISLGERQRLMLARMFLKKPRLILLDEATSNLDLELEDRILKNLVENLPRATLIMVTHRAPKNFPFDARYELKEGRLISIG